MLFHRSFLTLLIWKIESYSGTRLDQWSIVTIPPIRYLHTTYALLITSSSLILSITHSIFYDFNSSPSIEFPTTLLDPSKAFDKIGCENVLYKLQSNRVAGSLLIKSFHRVIFNDQSSVWKPITNRVLKSCVIISLLFIAQINELLQKLKPEFQPFADHPSLYSVFDSVSSSVSALSNDLMVIQNWASQWKMPFNRGKSK